MTAPLRIVREPVRASVSKCISPHRERAMSGHQTDEQERKAPGWNHIG